MERATRLAVLLAQGAVEQYPAEPDELRLVDSVWEADYFYDREA